MLCDIMTNRGSIMAITRHGINRADTGALMRCSFEETVEILMEAAAIGEIDYCTGVAENVLLGQVAPMGTGAFELSLDMEMLKEVVIDHRLPVHGHMPMPDGAMTPGGGMTPYAQDDGRTPMYDYGSNLGAASFSPIGDRDGGYDHPTGGLTPQWGGASPYGGASPFAGGASPVRLFPCFDWTLLTSIHRDILRAHRSTTRLCRLHTTRARLAPLVTRPRPSRRPRPGSTARVLPVLRRRVTARRAR